MRRPSPRLVRHPPVRAPASPTRRLPRPVRPAPWISWNLVLARIATEGRTGNGPLHHGLLRRQRGQDLPNRGGSDRRPHDGQRHRQCYSPLLDANGNAILVPVGSKIKYKLTFQGAGAVSLLLTTPSWTRHLYVAFDQDLFTYYKNVVAK